ncbi:helix-turn-helix transcriptional regulator [Humisphaera borealis]|uniref:Helix-turn-helix transcriptional regulator n=1 Tax=Humisphaera borealis TaxID=2807512 RepID=A0A7M2WVX4_9BACT|nr:helix-turn-helix transcriptional regulator [Humisphaera borealis]
MNRLGETAKQIREARGLSQKRAADLLDISPVHLCNVEKGKALPSIELAARYRDVFDADLFVVTWCLHGDVNALPAPVRDAAQSLASAFRSQLGLFDRGEVHAESKDAKESSI